MFNFIDRDEAEDDYHVNLGHWVSASIYLPVYRRNDYFAYFFFYSKTRQQSICINVFLLPYFKKEFPNHLYKNFWFFNCLTKWSILSEMLPSGMLIKHVTNFTYVTGMYTVRGSPLLHDKWWFIIKTRGFYLSGFTTKDGLLIQKILLLKTRSYVLFNDNWWIGY